jgi:thiol-disulfide isomerase/thioredoxin
MSDQRSGELQKKHGITTAALRAESATVIMQRGIKVTGRVTDPEGEPVEGAVVIWGDRPYLTPGSQETRSNRDGVFRFSSLPPGNTRLTVVAEGWMPESTKIEIGPKIEPANFQLKRGKKLRLKFVDDTGAPVPEVAVSIAGWRGAESLYNHKPPNVMDVKVPRAADTNGVFEWKWAPDDAVEYHFYKAGFATLTAKITADDQEQVQTINAVLRVSGSVTDAASGQPIDDFLAVPVIYFSPDFPFLERSHAQRQNAGKVTLEFDRTGIEHGIQIEAPGYVTYRSPDRYRIGQSNPALEIRLQPSERYTGRVLDAQGRGVKDASVYVATGFQSLSLQNLKDRDGNFSSNYVVKADGEGHFEIAPQIEPYALVVISDEGYAEAERAASERPGELRVERWAKVEGQLVQSGKPVPNCQVLLLPVRFSLGGAPRIEAALWTTTRDDGSFEFERVAPVACHVHGYLHFSLDSALASSRSMPLDLAPRETAKITLGGGGEIVGQLLAENQPADFDYHFSISYLVARRAGIEPPSFLASKRFDWRKGWSDSWRSTQEGGAYLNTLHNWFVKPEPDGRFKISGIEPGEYEFAVNLFGTTEGCLVHPLATRVVPVTVKPGDATLDLGKLSIPSMVLPKVGDEAPDFEFVNLDNQKQLLAELRGKPVLLDFWATWCGPCVAKLDEVERIRKQFGDEGELVVIGVNLDAETQRAKEFLKTRSLPWQHALLGDWSSTDIPRRFAISSVPAYVLIDAQGRIAAQEYSLDNLGKKLEGLKAPAGK